MENKNGQGIFYGVIGVATLVVAIIGATFAYFSASVSGNGSSVTGNTLDVTGTNLTLEVEKMSYDGVSGINPDLVPAVVTADETGWGTMLSNKCVDSTAGYTGCHVYKITADTESAIARATITLTGTVTGGATTTSNWKYVVYQGSKDAITAGTATSGNFVGTDTQLYSGALPTTSVERYLIVYLANTNSSQNGVGDGATIETGTYNGTVTLKAEGGEVKATFTASQGGGN